MPSSKHSRAGSGSDPPKKHRASLGRRAKETLPSSAYKQKKLAPLRRPRSTPTTRLWAVKQILRVKERRDGVRHYLIQWENTVDKRGKITHYPLSWVRRDHMAFVSNEANQEDRNPRRMSATRHYETSGRRGLRIWRQTSQRA